MQNSDGTEAATTADYCSSRQIKCSVTSMQNLSNQKKIDELNHRYVAFDDCV